MTKTDIELEMANNRDRALIGVTALHDEIARLRALLRDAAKRLASISDQPMWREDIVLVARKALAAIPEDDR